MSETNVGREVFLNFDRRLEKAKQDPHWEKIKELTLKNAKIGQSGAAEIYPPGFDPDLEIMRNYLRWQQGQLEINSDDELES